MPDGIAGTEEFVSQQVRANDLRCYCCGFEYFQACPGRSITLGSAEIECNFDTLSLCHVPLTAVEFLCIRGISMH